MATAVLLTLCLLIQTAPSQTAPVARAGDVTWGRAEYGEWMVERFGVTSLYDYVCEQVILLEAGKRGLLPTDEQLVAAYEAELERILSAAYRGDLAKWEADLVQKGFTVESSRARRLDELRAELATEAIVRADRDLSEAQVTERFRAAYGERGERLSLEVLHFSAYRGLVPGSRPDLAALKQAALERSQRARAAWAAGGQLADLLAEADDPGRDFIVQGVIAEYRPLILGKDIEAAVSVLDKPGDISPPIEAFDGTWLVRLASREIVSPEQVHDQLKAELHDAPVDSGEIQAVRNGLMERYQPELLLH